MKTCACVHTKKARKRDSMMTPKVKPRLMQKISVFIRDLLAVKCLHDQSIQWECKLSRVLSNYTPPALFDFQFSIPIAKSNARHSFIYVFRRACLSWLLPGLFWSCNWLRQARHVIEAEKEDSKMSQLDEILASSNFSSSARSSLGNTQTSGVPWSEHNRGHTFIGARSGREKTRRK